VAFARVVAGARRPGSSGTLEVVLPCGATLRVDGETDLGLLRAVVRTLGGGS
jgi:hypothetical protein